MVRGTQVAVATLLVAASATSCKGLDDGAREEFRTTYTCPDDRIELRARKDIDSYDLQHPTKAKPPPEVAADPGRLALWNKEAQEKEADTRAYYKRSHAAYELRGCGHTTLYDCNRPSSGSTSYYMCWQAEKYPPGSPPW